MSILLYGCTTRTQTKRLEIKLGGNYARILRATLIKSWKQHHTKQQLYCHLPPTSETIQVRRAEHCCFSIIHLRCIREVFSDALPSLPISGYFGIISAPTVTPVWLWKSQTASVIATCYTRTSTKAKKKN